MGEYADNYRRKLNLPVANKKKVQKEISKPKAVEKPVLPIVASKVKKKEESKPHKHESHIVEDVKHALVSKKGKKIERYVIFAIYAIIAIVALYFYIVNANPDVLPDEFYKYSLSAEDTVITNNLRSLYLLEDDVLSGETEFNDTKARLVVAEKPFNFVFNPKRTIAENTTAQLTLELIKPSTEVYLNDELIIPDLDNFQKVFENEEREVWVREDIIKEVYENATTAKDLIYDNYPGQDYFAFGEMEGGTPYLADYRPVTTVIKTQFRGDLKLAVYLEGDLELKFTKKDLNAYIGGDEYTVEITDLQGNQVFKQIYGDEDGKKNTGISEFDQIIEIEGKDLPRNIYYITFTSDKNNPSSDSSIKSIVINTNKVLIVGNTLPWGEFEFYKFVSFSNEIGFKYWWEGKDQEIEISGDLEKTIDLNESFLNKRYDEDLSRGEYNFKILNGYLWVYFDTVSPSEYTWFDLPEEGDSRLLTQEIIVIDKTKLKINGTQVTYTAEIPVKEGTKIQLQFLDKLETYFKEIKLVL